VLVVENDPDIRELLLFKLGLAGFGVDAVADGHAAWLHLSTHEVPSLVILDRHMPVMGGIEVLTRIRADSRLSAVPVLMLSGAAREVDVDEGFTAGASDYVTKPFSPREIIRRANVLIARQEALEGASA
jgi:DNA-binding response OmpR family regulator